MQEFSIISNVIKIVGEVSENEKFTKVNKVNLKIGNMRQVVPETLQLAFETISKGTCCESAILDVEHVPVKMKCNRCSNIFIVERFDYICPECRKADLKLLEGEEIELMSIEGD